VKENIERRCVCSLFPFIVVLLCCSCHYLSKIGCLLLNRIIVIMVVATSASIRRMVTRSSNRILIDDDMETAILHSGTHSIINSDDHKDELRFCNRLACILTKERDLPKLCQGFPTVVQTVNQHDVELQQHEPMMTFHHEQYQQFPPARINYDSFSVPPPSDR